MGLVPYFFLLPSTLLHFSLKRRNEWNRKKLLPCILAYFCSKSEMNRTSIHAVRPMDFINIFGVVVNVVIVNVVVVVVVVDIVFFVSPTIGEGRSQSDDRNREN